MRFHPTYLIRRITGGSGFIASTVQAGILLVNRFELLGGTVLPGVQVTADRQEFRGPTQALGVDTDLLGVDGTLVRTDTAPAIDIDTRVVSALVEKPAASPGILSSLLGASGDPNKPPASPGFDTDLLGAVGTAKQEVHTPGFSATPRITEYHVDGEPAFELVQVKIDLTRLVGANAQSAVGTAWTNPANALGIHDGTNATCVGSALGNTNGILLSYLDVPLVSGVLKGDMTIISATLHVYARVVDATGLLCDTELSYNIGAGLTLLEPSIAGAFDSLGTPRSYALPLLNTWTEYNALQFQAQCIFAAASLLSNAALDGVEIEILATRTDTI